MTAYEVVYGQKPPSVISYLLDTYKEKVVDNFLQIHATTHATIRGNLLMAQNCTKQQVDQHHLEITFEVGE